jgi:hypothetical protein
MSRPVHLPGAIKIELAAMAVLAALAAAVLAVLAVNFLFQRLSNGTVGATPH